MKSLCFTTEQGNYAFIAANLNKLKSMKYYLIQFEIILLKLNQVKFKLRCVDSNFKQIKSITKKSN